MLFLFFLYFIFTVKTYEASDQENNKITPFIRGSFGQANCHEVLPEENETGSFNIKDLNEPLENEPLEKKLLKKEESEEENSSELSSIYRYSIFNRLQLLYCCCHCFPWYKYLVKKNS